MDEQPTSSASMVARGLRGEGRVNRDVVERRANVSTRIHGMLARKTQSRGDFIRDSRAAGRRCRRVGPPVEQALAKLSDLPRDIERMRP